MLSMCHFFCLTFSYQSSVHSTLQRPSITNSILFIALYDDLSFADVAMKIVILYRYLIDQVQYINCGTELQVVASRVYCASS